MDKKLVTQEDIYRFLEGRDPQERIVNLEYSSRDDFITVVYRDEEDRKCKHKDPFYPFLWATREACLKLAGEDREHLKFLLRKYNIECKALDTKNVEGVTVEAAENGYRTTLCGDVLGPGPGFPSRKSFEGYRYSRHIL